MEGNQAETSLVSIISVTPTRAGRLFALGSVEIDIDGIQIAIQGIRALNTVGGTRIELPQFRDQGGALPRLPYPKRFAAMGDAVINETL